MPRVLVAHHDIAIREDLQPILRSAGCEVCTLSSSVEAVSQATNFRPDTFITEATMPELDGVKAAKQIVQAVDCRVLFLESRWTPTAEREEWLNRVRQEIANCDLLILPCDRKSILETVLGLPKEEQLHIEPAPPIRQHNVQTPVPKTEKTIEAVTETTGLQEIVAGVIGLLILLVLAWVAFVFYSPFQKLTEGENSALQKARRAAAAVLDQRIVQPKLNKDISERNFKALNSDDAKLMEATNNIVLFDQATSNDSNALLRIEPRGGNNLSIYLRKSDFETVLYPDRKEFVRAVGKAWCENTGEDSHWLLPSEYIGDIATGEGLASYSCVFDRVSL